MKFCEGICPACRGYGEHFDSCSVADEPTPSGAMSHPPVSIEVCAPSPASEPALGGAA